MPTTQLLILIEFKVSFQGLILYVEQDVNHFPADNKAAIVRQRSSGTWKRPWSSWSSIEVGFYTKVQYNPTQKRKSEIVEKN